MSEIDFDYAIDPGKERLIKAVSIDELLKYEFPRREAILSPIFTLGSLNMIFSGRGIGKTHCALGIGYAASSGSHFWHWQANRPIKTLYIDGEMPGEALQLRLAEIVASNDKSPPEGFLSILTIDLNEGRMPDLATLDGQIAIEPHCLDAELIIIDNLSCLCRSGKENEAASWLSIGEWAMRMRSLGKCVIFIHHAGKNGEQRGTSKREDILDVVVELKRPGDYQATDGARFIVQYTKARHLTGDEAKPFEAMLTTINGVQTWTTKTVEESTLSQVVALYNLDGFTQADIAAELGLNKSNVCRAIQKAKADGLIIDKPKTANKPQKRRADIDD